ncbi:MAG: IgA Peptidase M64 [Bacteroidales bacterium]|nr:IgA Peptidase M64 [Bacteroidales bacterium]
MKFYHILATALMGACALGASAQDFDQYFQDKTLRVDYIFGGDTAQTVVLLERQVELPGWAGRKIRLRELPLKGNGQVTVIDEASGDTIYRHSFSSLFQEWLRTEEAASRPRAFQNSYLVPLPKAPAIIALELQDSHDQPLASLHHRYDPADVLVEKRGYTDVTPHRYIHRSPRTENVINVAILAEGYTPEEMESFYGHAQEAVESMFSHEPYKSRPDDFNFIAVGAPSEDSGVSVPRLGEWKRTAVGSHYSTFYSDRYLTTDNVQQIHNLLAGIPYEHIIILANTEEYGGGGIYNSYTLTTSREANFRPVVVHEFGHSFGGLADEYFYVGDVMDDTYPTDTEPWEPNITTMVDFSSKWENQLTPGTPVPTDPADAEKYPVGVYEGGGYSFKGVYRPADDCRMRTNTYPTFCPVCEKALSDLIDFYTRP